MKEQVKALWKRCFDDSDGFIEMYFNLRYADEINVAIERDGQLVSALQMIPYPMSFCHHTIPTSYISGACTHPDYRGSGIMRELLTLSFADAQYKGILVSTLIPAEEWLFGYYGKMGYAPVFRYSYKEVVAPQSLPATDIRVTQVRQYQEEVYQYLTSHLSRRPCYLQHTSEDFRVVFADLAVSDGYLFVARQADSISGIAIGYQNGEEILIHELLADNKEVENCLLHHIPSFARCNRMVVLSPPNDELPQQPSGMARIINAPKLLQLYASAFPNLELGIELSDDQLPSNNGYYRLHSGVCTYTAERPCGTFTPMSVSQLTDNVFRPQHPYMSLMLS